MKKEMKGVKEAFDEAKKVRGNAETIGDALEAKVKEVVSGLESRFTT